MIKKVFINVHYKWMSRLVKRIVLKLKGGQLCINICIDLLLLLKLRLVFGERHEEILSVVAGDVLLELVDALRHQRGLFERKSSDWASF